MKQQKPIEERIARLPQWVRDHIEELNEAALVRSALRWTDPVKPDVAPPSAKAPRGTLSTGWHPYVTHGIHKACSSSTEHAIGCADHTTMKHPIWLYSTRILALKALRYAAEMEAARRLAYIDEQICEEEWK
jgi:hypothetical protein